MLETYEVGWCGLNRDGEEDAGCITVEASGRHNAKVRAVDEIVKYDVPKENIKIEDGDVVKVTRTAS